jgi:hypothetical protein
MNEQFGRIINYVLSHKVGLLQILGVVLLLVLVRFSVPSREAVGQATEDDRFLTSLQAVLADGRITGAFRYPTACLKCGQQNASLSSIDEPSDVVTLSPKDQDYFKTILREPTSFDQRYKIPGPFVADYGLVVEAPGGRALLLISSKTKRVRLVTREPEGIPLGTAAGRFPELYDRLTKLTGANER